jgi:glycosyltransferase involved in cell wall biosynthesis
MNVLQVHLADGHKGGGGGIAMHRLHVGLREAGIGSHILCRTKTLDSPDVTQIPRLPRIEYLLGRFTRRLGLNDIHLISSFGVKRTRAFQNADIIDFQGIHTKTLSYMALPALTKTKPAIFTMHDMWALTGHCSYSYDCARWKIGCGECPYPKTHPAIPDTPTARNNTRIEWRLKRWAYRHSDLAFAIPSTWLVELAAQSMLAEFPIHHIPYGLDTDTYRPMQKLACQAQLGLLSKLEMDSPRAGGGQARTRRRKVLMFAALKLDNHRKGGDLLLRALKGLTQAQKDELLLLTIGSGGEAIGRETGTRAHHLGYVDDTELKVAAYNAADLFLCPTRADNLPLVLLESLACGTPTVAFAVGGVPDIVRPGLTGYLAEPENVVDLRRGIVQLLEDEQLRDHMGGQARAIAVSEYRRELQTERYVDLYRQRLHRPRQTLTRQERGE